MGSDMKVTEIDCSTGQSVVRDATDAELVAAQAMSQWKIKHEADCAAKKKVLDDAVKALQSQQPTLAALLAPILQATGLYSFEPVA